MLNMPSAGAWARCTCQFHRRDCAAQTTQLGIQASAGALYASTIFIGIINSITVQPIAAEKRGVMYRERAAGMYSVFPWVAGMVGHRSCGWSATVFMAGSGCTVTPLIMLRLTGRPSLQGAMVRLPAVGGQQGLDHRYLETI